MGLRVACQPLLMLYRSHRAVRPSTLLDDAVWHLKICAHREYPNQSHSNPAFAVSCSRHHFDPSKHRNAIDRHFGVVGFRV